jgi:antitoxin MazE
VSKEDFMPGTVRKWGNSAAVRVPASVMQAARLELDAPVEIREEDGRIVIVPIREPEIALADLLAGVDDDNLHGKVEFGGPVGSETL